MSNRSLSAAGDQTTRRRLALGMRRARSLDNLFDVEFRPLPRVELTYADFERSPKLGKGSDAFEHFPPKLLLRGFGKLSRFGDRDFQCPDHGSHYTKSLPTGSPGVRGFFLRLQPPCSVVGSIILRISVILVAGKPLISACFLMMSSSLAR